MSLSQILIFISAVIALPVAFAVGIGAAYVLDKISKRGQP